MANLLNIPNELQLCIYKTLDNIDDALHLARTCRHMNAVFEVPSNRLIIFRSIIEHSPLHKYDLCITAGETFFANFFNTYYEHGRIPRRRRRPYYPDIKIKLGLKAPKITRAKPIPAETVWDIVCRWHAMKTLFHLYLDVYLRRDYMASQSMHTTLLYNPEIWQGVVGAHGALPYPCGHSVFALVPRKNTHTAYERFYRGLCLHWWLVNNLWSARIMRYRTSRIFDEMFLNNIRLRWKHVFPRSLAENVESFEVAEFVWGFLGRRIWEDRDLIDDWVKRPDNIHLWDQEVEHSMPTPQEWVLVSLEGMRYMRPGHIIDLLFHVWNRGSAGLDVSRYFCWMGFYDCNYGVRETPYGDDYDSDEEEEEDAGNDASNDAADADVADADADAADAADTDDDDEDFDMPDADDNEDDDDDLDIGNLHDLPDWVRLKLMEMELIAVSYFGDDNEPFVSEEDFWWDRYRFLKWQDELRGRPILFPEPAEDLHERIILRPQWENAARTRPDVIFISDDDD